MTPIPPISIWMSRMIFPAVVSSCATVTVDSPVALMALADRKKASTGSNGCLCETGSKYKMAKITVPSKYMKKTILNVAGRNWNLDINQSPL